MKKIDVSVMAALIFIFTQLPEVVQSRTGPEDNQVEVLQAPHGIVNPSKNLVLNNILMFTQMANGLVCKSKTFLRSAVANLARVEKVSDMCPNEIVDQSQAPTETAAILIIFVCEVVY